MKRVGVLSLLMLPAVSQAEIASMGIRSTAASTESLAAELDAELRLSMAQRGELDADLIDPEVCGSRALVTCLLEEGLDRGVDLALGGEVVEDATARVRVAVIDVGSEDLVVAFELTPSGPRQALGEDLARVLLGVVTEDIDSLEELRFDLSEGLSEEERSRVQDALQNRLSDAWSLELTRLLEPVSLEKTDSTDQDRSQLPPWERLGMEPQEYALFQASEMSLEEWREDYGDGSWSERVGGRRGRTVLRPTVAFGSLLHSSRYDGWYVLDASDTSWTGSAAWVGRDSGLGAETALWFGIGLTSLLQLDLGVGVAPARYSSSIQLEIPGDSEYDPSEDQVAILDTMVGARVVCVPQPMKKQRPIIGAGFRYLIGPETPELLVPTDSAMLPPLPGSSMGILELVGGLELQTRGGHDLVIAVPVGVGVLGVAGETYEAGNVELISADRERSSPSLSVGVELGLAFRVGGR